MNTFSRSVVGVVISAFGIVLIVATLSTASGPGWFAVLSGAACVGLGIYIFCNKHEDDIEDIIDNPNQE